MATFTPRGATPGRLARSVILALLACGATLSCSPAHDILSHGRFRNVTVYQPTGPVRQVVLLLSGDGGWQADTDRMASVLRRHGAMVVGIDEPALLDNETRDSSPCYFPDGDLENLSHFVQAYYHLPTYLAPVLAGYSAGASLAYALAAQAPPGVFAGALTLGFTPDFVTAKPFCKGEGEHFQRHPGRGLTLLPARQLPLRWIDVHGQNDSVCPAAQALAFVRRVNGARIVLVPGVGHDFAEPRQWAAQLDEALDTVAGDQQAAAPAAPLSLRDLPLVEVPATAPGNEDLLAVLVSGDGGWAGLDAHVAAALAARGIPVAGWDSLRYFWTARTPEGFAQDLQRTLAYYRQAWRRPRVLLIGYSQGADVLPFAVNRLPAATRASILATVLLGLGRNAAFEFHLADWIGPASGLPIRPEFEQMARPSTLCVYGTGDRDSLCGDLGAGDPRVVQLSGGHHFGGDYQGLANLILKFAGRDADHPDTDHAIVAPLKNTGAVRGST